MSVVYVASGRPFDFGVEWLDDGFLEFWTMEDKNWS
jgi:hypothetical protein